MADMQDNTSLKAQSNQVVAPSVLTEVLVGSRLHGLHTDKSDYDYRGIHIQPLKDVLSPFKTLKNTSWIEGDVDNTSYELADFCKQATHGNATILEVFFSDQIIKTSPVADEMRAMDDPDDDTNLFWYRTYTMPEFEARLAALQKEHRE